MIALTIPVAALTLALSVLAALAQPDISSGIFMVPYCDQGLACWQESWSLVPEDYPVIPLPGFLRDFLAYGVLAVLLCFVIIGIVGIVVAPFWIIYVYCWRVYNWGWRGLFTPLYSLCEHCCEGLILSTDCSKPRLCGRCRFGREQFGWKPRFDKSKYDSLRRERRREAWKSLIVLALAILWGALEYSYHITEQLVVLWQSQALQ